MEERAVVDRIEDGEQAVLLVGQEEREVVVPASRLPADARPGTWLTVETVEGAIAKLEVDTVGTEAAQARIAEKLRRLRERGRRRA